MRIAQTLTNDQIDQILEAVDDNISAIKAESGVEVKKSFLSDYPDGTSQAHAVALLRRLAENGLLHARLLGHDFMPAPHENTALTGTNAQTVGELMDLAMADMHRAVIDGDNDAVARRKGRVKPDGVLQALVG